MIWKADTKQGFASRKSLGRGQSGRKRLGGGCVGSAETDGWMEWIGWVGVGRNGGRGQIDEGVRVSEEDERWKSGKRKR